MDNLEQFLENIALDNAQLNIFLAQASPQDMAEDAGITGVYKGSLSGLCAAIKCNIAVQGLPFSAGIAGFEYRMPDADAFVVARLRAAGAQILGVVNMEEAALGATTNNPHFGRCENPLKIGYTPGGSSGGSAAAVAAGMADFALGTDTMGSCRIPAAYCGVVGFKPTYGRTSLDGVEPLAARLDHVGILASDVATVGLVAREICVYNPANEYDRQFPLLGEVLAALLQGKRFAVLDVAARLALTPAVARAYAQACAALTASGVVLIERAIGVAGLAKMRRAGLLICEAELANSLRQLAAIDASKASISGHLRGMIVFGATKSAPDLARAHAQIDAAVLILRGLMKDVDAICWPTAPQTAFSFNDPIPASQADFTCLANFTGAPAISLPIAGSATSLPVGLQLMMMPGDDTALLNISVAIEQTFRTLPQFFGDAA